VLVERETDNFRTGISLCLAVIKFLACVRETSVDAG
jgi:hypothetical protein